MLHDILLVLLGVVVTMLVINVPSVFRLLLLVKAGDVIHFAEELIEARTLDRVMDALKAEGEDVAS